MDAIRSRNGWCERSGAMKPDIIESPMNSTPRPRITFPNKLGIRRAFHMESPKPTATSRKARLLTSKAMICAVTVEPTAAPMMTASACPSVRIPAETKPIAITEVTDED